MSRIYTQEELDNDVPELEHIYREHHKQMADFGPVEDEDEDYVEYPYFCD